jgi:hypothetical protein
MKARAALALLAVLVLLPLGSGCGQAKAESALLQALAMVPVGTADVGFTDWAWIKAYLGYAGLTSKSTLEERRQFLVSYSQGPVPMADFVGGSYQQNAELWGWDSTDLLWEAGAALGDDWVSILRFRDDFDFAPLLALFAERGFSQGEYRGVTIYSHEKSWKLDWVVNDAILNAAVLPQVKVLILSREIGNVRDVLAAYQGAITALWDDGEVQATAGRLGEVAAARILTTGGTNLCPTVSIGADRVLPPAIDASVEEAVRGVTLHYFNTLGVGYRYEEGRPIDLVVLHYTSAGDAQADLEARRKLVAEGPSLARRGAHYSDYFTVERAAVEDSDVVLELRPVLDRPGRLFTMITNRDLLFASCP